MAARFQLALGQILDAPVVAAEGRRTGAAGKVDEIEGPALHLGEGDVGAQRDAAAAFNHQVVAETGDHHLDAGAHQHVGHGNGFDLLGSGRKDDQGAGHGVLPFPRAGGVRSRVCLSPAAVNDPLLEVLRKNGKPCWESTR